VVVGRKVHCREAPQVEADIRASVEEQLQERGEEGILLDDTPQVEDWVLIPVVEGSYLCMDNSFLLAALEPQAGALACKGLGRMALRKSHCHGHGLQIVSSYSF
jgi:hypothetical protein